MEKVDVLKNLLDIYNELYDLVGVNGSKTLFSKEFISKFKYSPEVVEKCLLLDEKEEDIPQTKIRLNIKNISTEEQVKDYFCKEINIFTSDVELQKSIKNINTDELKYLYEVLFGISYHGRGNKMNIISKIRDYFEDQSRTEDLSKSFKRN